MNRSAKHWVAMTLCALLGACATNAKKQVAPEQPVPETQAAAPDTRGDPQQRFKDALQLVKDKKPKEAQDALAALVTDFPEDSGPLTELGILHAQGKQRDKAFEELSKAVTVNPQNATAYEWLGILYRERGDYPRAEQSYLKAIALDASDADAHLDLGILYDAYLKRPRDALTQYREYQKIAGNDRLIVTAWIKQLEAGTSTPQDAGNVQ